jgi:lysozyme
MKISQQGLDLIKHFEGLVLHPYLDVVHVPTIGYGSTMYRNGSKVKIGDPPISQAYAEELLAWEVAMKELAVQKALGGYTVNQNQFDAIVSFAYNVGVGGFSDSTLLKKIRLNANDPTIRTEFMKWDKGHFNGKLVAIPALTDRRKREADLYFTPCAS